MAGSISEYAETHKVDLATLQSTHKDVNPFLIQKWHRAFYTFFDTNASKDIDSGDFHLITRHVKTIYGADSEQMTLAHGAMNSLWDGLIKLADKNKDQKISLDEWVLMLKLSQGKEPQWFTDYIVFLFKLFDVSADKKLDIEEFRDGMGAYGISREDAGEAFKKISVDSKTKNPVPSFDLAQFKALWHEYFYSTDANALGNHLFGIVTP